MSGMQANFVQVPDVLHTQTPFLLMATAGLRMLPDAVAEDILASCRHEILQGGFSQASTAVISGIQEGLYAWLSVNYVKNALPQVKLCPECRFGDGPT